MRQVACVTRGCHPYRYCSAMHPTSFASWRMMLPPSLSASCHPKLLDHASIRLPASLVYRATSCDTYRVTYCDTYSPLPCTWFPAPCYCLTLALSIARSLSRSLARSLSLSPSRSPHRHGMATHRGQTQVDTHNHRRDTITHERPGHTMS